MRIPLKKACLCVDYFFRGSLIPQKSILGEQDGEKLSKLQSLEKEYKNVITGNTSLNVLINFTEMVDHNT
jgi:hypothetical protein